MGENESVVHENTAKQYRQSNMSIDHDEQPCDRYKLFPVTEELPLNIFHSWGEKACQVILATDSQVRDPVYTVEYNKN